MTRMTTSEKQSFLAEPHVGVLAIPRAERGPLTVPVWYDYRPGGELWFLTGPGSRKGRLLNVGTWLSLCAQSESVPYRYVSVEGPVTAIDTPTAEQGLAMAVRYLGEKQGRAYAESGETDDSVLVRVELRHWLAVDYGKSELAQQLTSS